MLSTNAGQSMTKQKANAPKWGEVWFNKNGVSTILSLTSMVKLHRVMFDFDRKQHSLCIHQKRNTGCMFYHAPNYRTFNSVNTNCGGKWIFLLSSTERMSQEPMNSNTHLHAQLWKIWGKSSRWIQYEIFLLILKISSLQKPYMGLPCLA